MKLLFIMLGVMLNHCMDIFVTTNVILYIENQLLFFCIVLKY